MTILTPATIAVEGIILRGLHGVYPEERKNGNTFVIDLYVKADVTAAALSDQLADTLDYSQLYRLVEESMTPPVNLLEHLAHRIGARVMADFPQAMSVKVKIAKLHPLQMEHCERTRLEIDFVKTA